MKATKFVLVSALAVLILTLALAGGSTASAQKGKDKDKDKDKKPPTLTEAKGVTRLEYSPDGSFILADYRASAVKAPEQAEALLGIWDAKTGEFKVKFDKPPRNCERIAVSADNKKVAAIDAPPMSTCVWLPGMSGCPARLSLTVEPSMKPLPPTWAETCPVFPPLRGKMLATARAPPRSKAPMSHRAPRGLRNAR